VKIYNILKYISFFCLLLSVATFTGISIKKSIGRKKFQTLEELSKNEIKIAIFSIIMFFISIALIVIALLFF